MEKLDSNEISVNVSFNEFRNLLLASERHETMLHNLIQKLNHVEDKLDEIEMALDNKENIKQGDMLLHACKFDLPIEVQFKKIAEEYIELQDAVFAYVNNRKDKACYNHMGEECCDVIVACLTLLNHNFTDEKANELFKLVNDKNRMRGYLDE